MVLVDESAGRAAWSGLRDITGQTYLLQNYVTKACVARFLLPLWPVVVS